jgi:hypothetical protein
MRRKLYALCTTIHNEKIHYMNIAYRAGKYYLVKTCQREGK